MAFYEEMADVADEVLAEFKQSGITLTRVTKTAVTPPANEWDPVTYTETVYVYELDAVAKGVSQKFVDGDFIKATDLEVIAAGSMVLVSVDGVAASPVKSVLDTSLLDTLTVRGKPVVIIKDISVPAAGTLVARKYIVRR